MNSLKQILGLALGIMVATPAFAICERTAVRSVRETTTQTRELAEFVRLAPSKSYLESYQVTLVDDSAAPTKFETFQITLTKSDCSVVSLIPAL